jgi:predicted DNA-binding transcriptional regulator AlpA
MAKQVSFKWISENYGIPLSSLYLYNRQGRGPKCVRIGRHFRVSEEALDEWLATTPR